MPPRKENLYIGWSYPASVGCGITNRHMCSQSRFVGINVGVATSVVPHSDQPGKLNDVIIIILDFY